MYLPLIALLLAPPQMAKSPICSGDYASLESLFNQEGDALLNNRNVRKALNRLPPALQKRVLTAMSVVGPVRLIDCWLTIEGNAPHLGTINNAMVSFHLTDGGFIAAVTDNDRVLILTPSNVSGPGKRYDLLPIHVRDWVAVVSLRFKTRLDQPDNVLVMKIP